jgi:8-oxo-dGTP diphosphatase
MDPTAPDGCLAPRRGWAGPPLDTAHLRLSAATLSPALTLSVADRLSGLVVGRCSIRWSGGDDASLVADFPPPSWSDGQAAEALRRCLRMLFDDFAIALVDVTLPPPAPPPDFFRAHGFSGDDAGPWRLTRADWLTWRAGRRLVLVAAAALIDVDGRVLLAQRPAGKMMAGHWEFPGGKLAPGESPESALIRELKEELAIDVRSSCLAPIAVASHDYDLFHLVMPLFAVRQWLGRPRPQEGQTLAWAAKQHLGDYPMPPADIPLIAQLRDWL